MCSSDLTYAPLVEAARPGDRLLLDDGKIELRVEKGTRTELETTVVHGGRLGEHKGINAPGAPLPPDVSMDCSRVQKWLSFPLPRFSEWMAENEPAE